MTSNTPGSREELREPRRTADGRAGRIWATTVLFFLAFFALLVFIAQNNSSVSVHYFGAHGRIGLSIALLIAALAGAVLASLIALLRSVRTRLRLRS